MTRGHDVAPAVRLLALREAAQIVEQMRPAP